MTEKHLEDYSDTEIAVLFINDCIVPLQGNPPIPTDVLNQLLKMYCQDIGVAAPTKALLVSTMRKYYTMTNHKDKVCFRAGLKPGLIPEDL